MFRRNSLKLLFFSLMMIILTYCEFLKNSEILQNTYKFRHEDVLAKITSDYEVCIYQKDKIEWVLTQQIKTGTEILEVFLSGKFLIIEEESNYLTLYEGNMKMESSEIEY